MQETFDIADDFNVENVYDGLMKLGAGIALKTIDKIIAGNGHVDSLPQEDMIPVGKELHNAPKIFKETCRINWNMPAERAQNFVRGLSPYPGAWTNMVSPDGKNSVLKLFKAALTQMPCNGNVPGTIRIFNGNMLVATADCWLQLDEIQLSGKKRMDARAFLNGFRDIESYTLER